MKTITALTLAAALLSPALAFACPADHKEQQAMSCAEGTSWDAQSRSCKPTASS